MQSCQTLVVGTQFNRTDWFSVIHMRLNKIIGILIVYIVLCGDQSILWIINFMVVCH
jgi:hypothetical protein